MKKENIYFTSGYFVLISLFYLFGWINKGIYAMALIIALVLFIFALFDTKTVVTKYVVYSLATGEEVTKCDTKEMAEHYISMFSFLYGGHYDYVRTTEIEE